MSPKSFVLHWRVEKCKWSTQFCHLSLVDTSNIFIWRKGAQRARASSLTLFLDQMKRRNTVGRTPLDEWSQRPLPDNTQQSQGTDIHIPDGIRTHSLSRRAAADQRFRPRGHWDRQTYWFKGLIFDWDCISVTHAKYELIFIFAAHRPN